jgi:membrane-bound serine protease (ClpP class)
VVDQIEAWGAGPEIQTQLLSSQAAIDAGLAQELQADQAAPATVLDFLQQADGHEVLTADGPVTFHSASTTDPAQGGGAVAAFKSLGPLVRVLHAVASPTAILLLISLGLAGIAFEFTQPGFGFAGISGIVSLGLGVYGMTAVPPSWYGLALLVGGVVMLMVDVRRKRLGAMSYLGVVAYGAGEYLLYPSAAPAIAISVWMIGAMVVATILYYFFALTVAQQAHDRVTEMQMALVGLPGEVRSDLNPVGGVVVKGTVWRARTTGDHLLAGTKVRVKGVAGVVLQVAPDETLEGAEADAGAEAE